MDVESMTPEQVRREIAERLGYAAGWLPGDDEDGGAYVLYDPDGEVCSGPARDSVDDLWRAVLADDTHNDAIIPDWTRDTSAALALCLEIAQFEYTLRLYHMRHADGHVLVGVEFDEWDDDTDEQVDVFVASADTPALALSRLALLELRAQEGRDG